MLSQTFLKSILHYDPATGVFTRLVTRGHAKKGTQAGTIKKDKDRLVQYRRINILGTLYYEHQLAFLYMQGRIPKFVDHKNCDGCDNRWVNLREATQSQNQANTFAQSNSTYGKKGVTWNKRENKWMSGIMCNRQKFHIGYFNTKEEAAAAYVAKAKELFGEFARIK